MMFVILLKIQVCLKYKLGMMENINIIQSLAMILPCTLNITFCWYYLTFCIVLSFSRVSIVHIQGM